MNKLLLSLLLLALVAIASTRHHHHHHKRRGGVKKIVKVITINGKPPAPAPTVIHSASSSSSEEEETPVSCDEGWLTFNRANGVWCVLVGNKGADNHQLSQPEAEKLCKKQSATLTGIQNDEERMEIANEALHQLGEIKIENGAVWLGATTYAACRVKNCGATETFKWTDGLTTGTGGFKWGQDEPDNKDYPGKSACIQQIVMTKTFKQQPHEKWLDAFKHGDLDKYRCEDPEKPTTRLYACGRKAR